VCTQSYVILKSMINEFTCDFLQHQLEQVFPFVDCIYGNLTVAGQSDLIHS